MTRSMNFDVTARDSASSEFLAIAAASETLEQKLRQLDGLKVEPNADFNITAANRKIDQLKSRLDAISNVRATVETPGAAESRQEITALVVELRKIRNATATITIRTGTAKADLTTIAAKLEQIRDRTATVRVSSGDALPRLSTIEARLAAIRDATARIRIEGTVPATVQLNAIRARLQQIRDITVRVQVQGDGIPTQIAALRALNGQTVRIRLELDAPGVLERLTAIVALIREARGRHRIRIDADTAGINAATSGLTRMQRVLLGVVAAGGAGIVINGLPATAAQALSVAGALLDAAGAAGLLPAAMLAGGAAAATLQLGLRGVSDALEETDPTAYAEALAQLAPEAAAFVREVRNLGPAWRGVQLDTQNALFRDMAGNLQQLSAAHLPGVQRGLTGIAGEINRTGREFTGWATAQQTVRDVDTILGNTTSTARNLSPAVTNVAAALTDVGVVGSGILPELATGAAGATGRFRELVAEARRTGELEVWIRGGIATLQQLGSIAGNAGGAVAAMIRASEEAGFDFLDVVEQATGELDELLNSARGQNALVSVFTEAGTAADRAWPGVRTLAGAVVDTVGAFANSGGVREFADLVSDTASGVSPLVAELGSLAGDGLGAVADAANIAVDAATPVVSVVAAVVGALGPLPGAVLASVVAVRALAGTTAAITGWGAAMAANAVMATSWVGAMTGSTTAAAAAGAASRGLGTALTAVGRALPFVVVGAIAASAALNAWTVSNDDATAAMNRGGQAADDMRARIEGQTAGFGENLDAVDRAAAGFQNWFSANVLGRATVDSVTESLERQRAGMTELERAQQDATRAQGDYQQAVDEFGRTSPQATAAAAAYAAAVDAVAAAERDAAAVGRDRADVLRDQISSVQSALGTNLALEESLRRVADAERAANDAVREHGAGSTEAAAALDSYVGSVDQAAQAAAARAQAEAEAAIAAGDLATTTDVGAIASAAYANSLLSMAATASGPARDALLGHVATLTDAQLEALSAAAAATGFATTLLTLPDGRTVRIAVDPETGEIITTQQMLDTMRDADVAVNLETQQALDDLGSFIGIVNGAAGTVNIDGNPQAAGTALQNVLAAIAAGEESVTINGQTVPAASALSIILGQIQASNATVTINGQAVPASQVLSQTLGAINSGQGTVTIAGQSFPAQAVLTAIIGTINRGSGAVTIRANDLVGSVLASYANRSTTTWVTIRSRYENATGAILTPMATGGVLRRTSAGHTVRAYASGGTEDPWGRLDGRRLTPMSGARAASVAPGSYRVIGDNLTHTELYIPLDGSRSSRSYLAYGARAMGMDLVPRGRPGSGLARSRAGLPSSAGIVRAVVGQPAQQHMSLAPVAAAVLAGNAELRAEIATLGRQLRDLPRGDVVQNFPNATDSAESQRSSAVGYRAARGR